MSQRVKRRPELLSTVCEVVCEVVGKGERRSQLQNADFPISAFPEVKTFLDDAPGMELRQVIQFGSHAEQPGHREGVQSNTE